LVQINNQKNVTQSHTPAVIELAPLLGARALDDQCDPGASQRRFAWTLSATATTNISGIETRLGFMKSSIFLVLAAFISCSICFSQDERTFINPGFKLGYRFGENGGFAGGIELSITRWSGYSYAGVLFSIDHSGKTVSYHCAFEAGRGLIGVSIGPVMVRREQSVDYGFSVTPYAGLILIPYYRFTYLRHFPSEHEIGSYIKIPIQTVGERFSLGG
jgi:hypothetical protein